MLCGVGIRALVLIRNLERGCFLWFFRQLIFGMLSELKCQFLLWCGNPSVIIFRHDTPFFHKCYHVCCVIIIIIIIIIITVIIVIIIIIIINFINVS